MKYHKYADRAKIFAPFDALRGLQEALREQERLLVRVEQKDLLPDQEELIDRRLHRISPGDLVTIIYYDGDAYVKKTGLVASMDPVRKEIRVVEERIPFQDIFSIETVGEI